MRDSKGKKLVLLLIGVMVAICMKSALNDVPGSIVKADDMGTEQRVSVLFTHDLHSHIKEFSTVYRDENVKVGGFARLQTLIEQKRAEEEDVLVVDGGDFSMGTLFQTIYETQAPELRLMGQMGVDATVLGNHEFDYRSEGLMQMLQTALNSGDTLPQLLLCNVDWSDCDEEQAKMKAVFDEYGIKDYCIVEKNGVRIALIGVFGIDALACAPTCTLKFEDPVQAVADTVEKIHQTEDADMLVCLSHSGTSERKENSEDEILAQKVPQLDLIISAHTHTTLEEPIVCGETTIVSAGEYGKALGSLEMVRKDNGRWSFQNYELIPVTSDIEPEMQMQKRIEEFETLIDEDYLTRFGYKANQVLAYNKYPFSTESELNKIHTEHTLGNLIADSYVYAVEHADGYNGVPVDMAVAPAGTIRDTYIPGYITVENVFNSFSLGIGKDKVPGYPLIDVYLTGEELKTAAEIDASISDFMNIARLYINGMNMTYNPNRLILNKTTKVELVNHRLGISEEEAAQTREPEKEKLYRVITDLHSGQMLSAVTDKSYGLLSIVPKHADGTPVTDFEDCIIYDDGKELKAWVAIAEYMQSFELNGDGIPEIPSYYSTVQGRKNIEESKNIIDLIKNPNKYAFMIIGIVTVIILIIALTIRGVCVCLKRKKRKKSE